MGVSDQMANQTSERNIKTYFQDFSILHIMPPPLYLSAEVTFEQAPENAARELLTAGQLKQ